MHGNKAEFDTKINAYTSQAPLPDWFTLTLALALVFGFGSLSFKFAILLKIATRPPGWLWLSLVLSVDRSSLRFFFPQIAGAATSKQLLCLKSLHVYLLNLPYPLAEKKVGKKHVTQLIYIYRILCVTVPSLDGDVCTMYLSICASFFVSLLDLLIG